MRGGNIVIVESGLINARVEGAGIICLRLLLYCPSSLTSPVMHCQRVYKLLSALTANKPKHQHCDGRPG